MSSSSDSVSSSSASSEVMSSSSSSEGVGLYGIKLNRYAQSRYVVNQVDGFRLRIVASNARGMSEAIFRYMRGPGREVGSEDDVCDGVCSSVDLEEFPVGDPDPDQAVKYFRSDTLDCVFRSKITAEEAWDVVLNEVATLILSLEAGAVLGDAVVVSFGNPAD